MPLLKQTIKWCEHQNCSGHDQVPSHDRVMPGVDLVTNES